MSDSYYGWCCARGCQEEATKRLQASFGDSPVLLVPVCSEHLAQLVASLAELRGEALAIKDGPQ